MKHLKLKMTGLVLTLIWLSAMGTMAQVSGDRGNDIRFAGSISGIARNESGMAVQLTIEVSNAQVQLNLTRWTEVIQGQGFDVKLGDFQLNDYIEVSGFFTSTGNIVAREIHLRREDTLQSDGVVDSLTGQSITVNGVEFSVDEQSRIHAAGQVTQGSLAEIFVGDRVRVLAANTNGRLGVLELEYGERTIETEKLAFEGFVETMQNGLLTVDVGVPGTSAVVSTDTDTEIIGSIAGGVLVEVEGQFIPGTALVRASRINADNNQNGNVYDDSESDSQANDYEFDGVIQSLGPAGNGGEISEFSVGQTLVRIDGQTRIHFNDGANTSSSALQTGQAVDVKGTLKSDGSIHATEIEIK